MPRKPVVLEEFRQRSLEGVDEGLTRSKLRDVVDRQERVQWLQGLVLRAANVLAIIGAGVVVARDWLVEAIHLIFKAGS